MRQLEWPEAIVACPFMRVSRAMSEALFAAAMKASLKGIQAAVEAGADVNATDPEDGYTALAMLCKSKSGAMSKSEVAAALWLIDRGADVNKAGSFGDTPLHLAADSGSREVIEALIAKGATIARTKHDQTPLHYCLDTRDKDTALWDRLIELGCGIEDRTEGSTALLRAVGSHNVAAVKYLIARGADLGAKDSEGSTALDVARKYKNEKIIKLLEAATK